MANTKSHDEKIKAKTAQKSIVDTIVSKNKPKEIEQIDPKIASTFIEVKPKRDARVNYKITTETREKLKRKCKYLGVSENEVINQLLDNFVSDM